MAFDSILVANRGEIACRIIRTAHDLGLRTIAVYSEVDANAPHVALADEAVLIGPGPAADSYLNIERVLEAAKASGAGAIHPGYGFLSENELFADAVDHAGLVFIGPPASAIRKMGNKAEAKRLMGAANVPCVPGFEVGDLDDAAVIRASDELGFPVMVKAAAGGGGRGMRLARGESELAAALSMARSEALNAFGSSELIIEKALERARHVEVQIFADNDGHCIHLGERDCSVQRRHQKIIEEAPCPAMNPDLSERMGKAAVAAAIAVDYRGAGTVEFMLDTSSAFYFLEMNTRLQVEHPVTEMVTGLDLVAMQIAVAQGEPLALAQHDVRIRGHAIEARLYAEDPARDFLPGTGPIALWRPASGKGIRIDCGIKTGLDVSPYYDPLLAKIIAWGETREIARNRLVMAIRDSVLLGPVTNSAFLADIVAMEDFTQCEATTAFLGDNYPDGVPATVPGSLEVALAAALSLRAEQNEAFAKAPCVSPLLLGWSSAALLPTPVHLRDAHAEYELSAGCKGDVWTVGVGKDQFAITLEERADQAFRARVNDRTIDVVAVISDKADILLAAGARRFAFQRIYAGDQTEAAVAGGRVLAPMPGLVIELLVREGQEVAKGKALAILEAMKMQHRIVAPVDGIVKQIVVKPGEQAGSGDLMFEIEDAGKAES
tara:strand:- start:72573 stop:74564 length:1992 start_codon:yes stop_codon:yes gene_type:complete